MIRKTKNREQLSTGAKIRQTLIVILTVLNIAVWGTGIWQRIEDSRREEIMGETWFPMANQHIEWYYAGKPMD